MQFDTPIPSTYPSEGALLQTLPVQNFSVQKWPFKGLTIFHVWVEEGKNKTKKPWPLKNGPAKFKGQFSWNEVLNHSALFLSTRSPVSILHPLCFY